MLIWPTLGNVALPFLYSMAFLSNLFRLDRNAALIPGVIAPGDTSASGIDLSRVDFGPEMQADAGDANSSDGLDHIDDKCVLCGREPR